ncbi:MAG: hypothetical protein HY239_08650 [Mycolicibacterium aromaticivorans]|nr:hypothetical protein [Mycolicibacterium aromaticivorans]
MLSAWKIELRDWLRFNPAIRSLLCRLRLATDATPPSNDPQAVARSIQRLCGAARLAPTHELLLQVEARLHERVRALDASRLDWREFEPDITDRRIPKAVVLKPRVSEREKGVVLFSFEYQWARLLRGVDLKEFSRSYAVVLAPTWSPPHSLVNCVFPEVFPEKVFSLISNRNDLEHFPRISAKNVMVPLFASNWVNPALYQPVPFERKDVDIFMLANFGEYKRHFALFKALRDLPRSLRVLLIGQSCVAVVESLFANTPVGLYEDAIIGSRYFINEHSGRLLQHDNLAGQLKDFLSAAHRFSPRQWALETKIDSPGSTATLNRVLRENAVAAGQEWTQDIAVHHWRPDPVLLLDSDRARLRPAQEDIERRFGLKIG